MLTFKSFNMNHTIQNQKSNSLRLTLPTWTFLNQKFKEKCHASTS